MDSTELNIERRRKRRTTDAPKPIIDVDKLNDPYIKELILKERQFMKMLTSTIAPIHSNIAESLENPESTFGNFAKVRGLRGV